VKTKQGSLKGVLVIPPNRELQPVEAFLGLPYASPPVGALRYMPPVSPISWNGIRLMDKYGPACPQTLPDITNEREALRFVTRGRLRNNKSHILSIVRSSLPINFFKLFIHALSVSAKTVAIPPKSK
jgi:neuroligin